MLRDRGTAGHVDQVQPDRIRTPLRLARAQDIDDALEPLLLGNPDASPYP